MNQQEQNDFLNKVACILLWSFILSMALLIFWFFVFLVGGNFAYSIHSKMYDITKHEFDLIMYCGMAIYKLCIFVFLLFPYFAIKIVLRKKEK